MGERAGVGRPAGVRRVVITVAAWSAASLAAATAVLGLDSLVDQGVPTALRLGSSTAQALLLSLAVSYLAAAALVLRLRAFALQVTAGGLPARMTRDLLTDRVQRHAAGFVIGAFVFDLAVLRALPDAGAGMAAMPQLAVNVATVLPVAVGAVILALVHDAARASSAGRLVHRLADDCIALAPDGGDRSQEELGRRLDTLADIAERMLSQDSRDSTVARHVIWNVGAVLCQRPLLAGRSDARVDAVLDRLRSAAASTPEVAATLVASIAMLARAAHSAGRHDRALELSAQARLVVKGLERSGCLEHDVRCVRERVLAERFST
ncbi:MAG: DUF2254 family protein [Solirubrobacteraceae bacterium]|nr:DUF2254 family protein [Solirubrobacteraceae bacterium]